jgi:nucleoid-associated protein EbfC
MKFPGGFDMNSMMKQAQKMQEEMGKQMKTTVVDASAGGGAVAVKMRGDFEVLELTISPDLVKDGDVEMIQARSKKNSKDNSAECSRPDLCNLVLSLES